MILFKSRRKREFIIVHAMIRMYCRNHHASGNELCESCEKLAQYSEQRLDRCAYGDTKPVCKDCEIHCYAPSKREEMRSVMKWSGPRMLFVHPLYTLIHLVDSKSKKKQVIKSKS
jgi:hypothetical protein